MPAPLVARGFRQTRLRQDVLAAINRLNNPMRLHSTLGAPFGGYEANREIVTIYFSPDGSPDAVDSAGAVVISGGDCIISSSRRTWSCLPRRPCLGGQPASEGSTLSQRTGRALIWGCHGEAQTSCCGTTR